MGSWIPKTIGVALEEAAAAHAEREFLVVEGRRTTYGHLAEMVRQFSRGLLRAGVRPGEKAALWLANGLEWVCAMFSLARIGAVFVPINGQFKTEEAEYILRQSDSSVLLLAPRHGKNDYLGMVRELCPELSSCPAGGLKSTKLPFLKRVICTGEMTVPGAFSFDEIFRKGEAALPEAPPVSDAHQTVSILYTSGSTAFPKGVMLTHHNILRNGYEIGERLALRPEDRYFNPCPYYHNAGLVDGLLAALTHGSCNVTLPSYDARAAIEMIEKERCTVIGGIQTMFTRIMEDPSFEPKRVATLQRGWTTGPPQTVRDIHDKMGVAGITNLYGISEASPCCSISDCANDPLEDRIERMGKPLPGVEMKMIDSQTGEPLSPGEKGEICVRGWNLMQGYYRKPEETAKAVDREGWLHTGDLGFIDEKGLVFFIGRIKNVIRSGGENISPEEVEAYLCRHPKVKHVEVVGLPDQRWGQRLAACVELKEGIMAEPEEIIAFCKGRIANFKVPKEVHFVTAWPLTGSGKVQKFKLVERLTAKANSKS